MAASRGVLLAACGPARGGDDAETATTDYDDRYFVILHLRGGYLSFALTIDQAVALIAAVQEAIDQLEP